MKLKQYSKEKARNFAIAWTGIFCLFSLMVIWSLMIGYRQSLAPEAPSSFWAQSALLVLVLASLLAGAIGMWIKYLKGEFEGMRKARNIAFIFVLLLYPLGVLLNLLMGSLAS